MSALVSWKNPANNFGVLLQGFSEKQSVRRDGQEVLGYTPISATSAAAVANPALAGVSVPTFIGAALFEQKKKREGGAFDIEAKPSREFGIDLNGFYSKLQAPHQNTNWLAAPANSINRDNLIPQNPVIRNGTLAEPVREVTIASTLPRLLLDLVAVGSEIEWLPGGSGSAALVFGEVALSGS